MTFCGPRELIYSGENSITKVKLRSAVDKKIKEIPAWQKVTFLKVDELNPDYLLVGYEHGLTEIRNSNSLLTLYSSSEIDQNRNEAPIN